MKARLHCRACNSAPVDEKGKERIFEIADTGITECPVADLVCWCEPITKTQWHLLGESGTLDGTMTVYGVPESGPELYLKTDEGAAFDAGAMDYSWEPPK